MLFNINDDVRVKLTDKGREVLRKEQLHDYLGLVEDEEGWSTWQFWVLMSYFAHHIGMGFENVFEMNIDIIEKEDK